MIKYYKVVIVMFREGTAANLADFTALQLLEEISLHEVNSDDNHPGKPELIWFHKVC